MKKYMILLAIIVLLIGCSKGVEKNPIIVLCANCHRELHAGILAESVYISKRLVA